MFYLLHSACFSQLLSTRVLDLTKTSRKEEEEEPYLLNLKILCALLLSFVPLYHPTHRSCFKEFRPPVFLRIAIFDTLTPTTVKDPGTNFFDQHLDTGLFSPLSARVPPFLPQKHKSEPGEVEVVRSFIFVGSEATESNVSDKA